MDDGIGLDKRQRDARVNLTCIRQGIEYTLPFERALRVVIEEWDTTRQNHACINHPGAEFGDLYIDQIRGLHARL